MKYTLMKPFQFGKETISEVEIKEDYDTGDVARLMNAKQKGAGDAFAEIIAIGTDWPVPKVSKIGSKDGLKIFEIVNDFLDDGEGEN